MVHLAYYIFYYQIRRHIIIRRSFPFFDIPETRELDYS